MLRQAGEQRLRHPLVERRVPPGQQLCTGVVHTGTGEGHVITAGYEEEAHRQSLIIYCLVIALRVSQEGAEWRHTRGTETEGARGAEAAAPYSGSQWKIFILQARLIFAGRNQQADVGVQLDEEAALKHPHHHLDQLGLEEEKHRTREAEQTDVPNRVKYFKSATGTTLAQK